MRLALNLAVNKKAIIQRRSGAAGARDTPYSYYYYPFNKGYSADWKVPPYDLERARSCWPRPATPAASRCG